MQPTARRSVECTTSKVAPVLDGIMTGYEIVRIVAAGVVDDSAYRRSPISREADALLGVAFAGLFLGSTIYGVVSTSRCARLKNGPAAGEELPGITHDFPVDEPTPALPPVQALPPEQWQVDPQAPPPSSAPPSAAPPSAAPEPSATPAPSTELPTSPTVEPVAP